MLNFNDIQLDKKILNHCGVGAVIIFGSQVNETTHPQSDLDIGIVFFDKKKLEEDPVEVYGTLYEEFSKIFKDINKIDIVYLHEAPLALQFKAVQEGKVLYSVNPSFFCDYKERTLLYYFDFQYFDNIFKEAFINP